MSISKKTVLSVCIATANQITDLLHYINTRSSVDTSKAQEEIHQIIKKLHLERASL